MNKNITVIEPLKLIRKINQLSEHYYSNTSERPHNHTAYLKDCNIQLFDFFMKYFGQSFLFSALSYINHTDSHIRIAEGNKADEKYKTNYNFNTRDLIGFDSLASEINNSLKEIEDVHMVSMTRILLSAKNRYDLFFLDNSGKYDQEIICEGGKILALNLSELEQKNSADEFYRFPSNKKRIDNFGNALTTKTGFWNFALDNMGKYIWHFKKMSMIYKSTNNDKPFIIHFIRPSITEFNYNLLLSLATNRCLTAEELALVDLFIYRIVSQMVVEKLDEAQKLKSLNSISFATHAIKTTLQGTLLPQAQITLGKVIGDYKAQQKKYINEIKDLIKLTELINVSSKIVAGTSQEEISKNLEQTGLLTEISGHNISEIDLGTILNNIIEQNNSVGERTSVCLFNKGCIIPFNFLTIQKFYLNEKFYKHFCLTVFENFYTYGVGAKNFCDRIDMEYADSKITITNIIKGKYQKKLEGNELTGNLGLYKNIIEKTFKAGKINHSIEKGIYTLTIEKS